MGRPWSLREYKKPPVSPLKETWKTSWMRDPDKPRSIKQMQSDGMRNVPITLPKIPESRVLTKDELK